MKKQHQQHKEEEAKRQPLSPFTETWEAEITYANMDFDRQSLSLECNLKDLKLKIKRIKKKDVMDDKFALLFHCAVTIQDLSLIHI